MFSDYRLCNGVKLWKSFSSFPPFHGDTSQDADHHQTMEGFGSFVFKTKQVSAAQHMENSVRKALPPEDLIPPVQLRNPQGYG